MQGVGRQCCEAASGSSQTTTYCCEYPAGMPPAPPASFLHLGGRAGSSSWLCWRPRPRQRCSARRVRPSAAGQLSSGVQRLQ